MVKIEIHKMKIKVKKLYENATLPKYAHAGDAGMDLTVYSVKPIGETQYEVGFGIAVEIPVGHVGLIFPRSSIFKTGTMLSNSVGVIDSGYRGEVKAVFQNIIDLKPPYEIGERAAQMIILPYPACEIEESETLSDTERGECGYGSTGK